MPHIQGHSKYGDGFGNTKPSAPPGQNPYGPHIGYGSNNNSSNTNTTSSQQNSNAVVNTGNNNYPNTPPPGTNDNKNNSGSVNETNSNSTVNNVFSQNDDLESNIPQGDENWVTTTSNMNSWQTSNDTVNTFFTGGQTKLNSKDWETQKLFNAGNEILKSLGLENNKKNMQIAMNILQGGDRIWGKTSRALQNATQEQINAIAKTKGVAPEDLGTTGKWNTWGTNLRGDATWGGSPTSQEDYEDKMTAFSGNWEAGSNMYKYQQMLVDGWQSANPNYKNSGSNKLGAALLTAMIPISPAIGAITFGAKGIETIKGNLSKPTNIKEVLSNPLGALIPKGWISDSKEGIKKLHINGDLVTINDKTVNRNDTDGGIFSKYDLVESDLGKDSGTQSSSPYYSNSYNIEDIIDEEEEKDDEGESENTLTADENPAWWNFKLFETMFSPYNKLKYQEGDIVENNDETVAPTILKNIIEQAREDEQAKVLLQTLIEENEQMAEVVNNNEDIKASVEEILGPLEIDSDVEDLSIQQNSENSGFMPRLENEEINMQEQIGNLNLEEV